MSEIIERVIENRIVDYKQGVLNLSKIYEHTEDKVGVRKQIIEYIDVICELSRDLYKVRA